MDSLAFCVVVLSFFMARCLASRVLKNDKNCTLMSSFVALGCLSEKVMYHVNSLFLKAPANYSICLSSSVSWLASQVDSQTNQCRLGSSSPSYRGMCADPWPMSESLSMSSLGGGSGDGGVICLFLSTELSSMKLSFPSIVLVVIYSSISIQLLSNFSIDVQLQLSVPSSECSVFSKAVFGRGGAPSFFR